MRKGERIVFEATGRTSPQRGEQFIDGFGEILTADMDHNRTDFEVVRRVSPERVAAEQDVIADALEDGRSGALKWTSIERLNAAIAAEAPKPRFEAEGSAVIERREITASAVGKLCRATFTGPNAELYAKEHAERLEREAT